MLSVDSLILYSSLACAALSVYMLSSFLFSSSGNADQLAWASGDEPTKSKSSLLDSTRTIMHNLTLRYAQQYVTSASYRKKIEKNIKTAGLERELNVDEYIGFQILLGIFLPAFVALLNYALLLDLPWFLIVGFAGFGFRYPKMYCDGQKNQRYLNVVTELPFYIDMLALSTEANLEFMNAVKRVVEKSKPESVLAKEFSQVLSDINIGASRSDALKNMAARLDIPEITSFVAIATDSFDTGASISKVLKDQSIQMRTDRFARAEKAGARASQTMLIPMMFLIMPAVFVVVFAPAVLQFFGG